MKLLGLKYSAVFLAAASTCFLGCSHQLSPARKPANQGYGTLIIARTVDASNERISTTGRVFYSVDDRIVAALAPGQSTILKLPAGDHFVQALIIRGSMLLSPSVDTQGLKIDVAPATVSYASHQPALSGWQFQSLSAELGAKAQKNTKSRPMLHAPMNVSTFVDQVRSRGKLLDEQADKTQAETMASVALMATRLTSLSAQNAPGAVNLASPHYSVDHAVAANQSIATSSGVQWTLKLAGSEALVQTTSDIGSYTVKLDSVESTDGMRYRLQGADLRSELGHAYHVSGNTVTTSDGLKCVARNNVMTCSE